MTSSDILDVFNDCIERLHAGESIGDCLRAHPQHADTLRRLLAESKPETTRDLV